MGPRIWLLILSFGTAVTIGDRVSPGLVNLFLHASPSHLQFRTPSPNVWTPEVESAKYVENEEYTGAFPTQAACSEVRKLKLGDTGTIQSPYYPRNYDSNLACEWILEGPPKSQIEIVFFDVFTQGYFVTYYDYLMVARNGDFSRVDRMAGDVNGKTPMVITSEKNVLGIRFRSSTFFNYRGFKAQYIVTSHENEHFTRLLESSVYDGVCGQPGPVPTPAPTEPAVHLIPDEVPYVSTKVEPDNHIFNGTEAAPNAYPWMVALLVDNKQFCAGTLIDDQHVLTAAHCTNRANTITALLGSHSIQPTKRGQQHDGRLVFTVMRANIFQHPEYNEFTVANDISIIRLPEKVVFNDQIKPICLPNRYYLAKMFTGDEVRVTGWGKVDDDSLAINPNLKEADVMVIPNNECRVLFRAIVTGNILCINPFKRASPCKGDSGGPIMIKQNGPQGPYFLQVGIVSFGSTTCEQSLPIGSTRLTAYVDYINQITGKQLKRKSLA